MQKNLIVYIISNMEHYGKEKKVYSGIWIPFILIIAVPTVNYFLFFWAISQFSKLDNTLVMYTSIAFAGLTGVLFFIGCLISGFVHDLFEAMIYRIKDTIEFFGWFSIDGIKYYFREFIHDGGPILWMFFILMLGIIAVTIFGFVKFAIGYGLM